MYSIYMYIYRYCVHAVQARRVNFHYNTQKHCTYNIADRSSADNVSVVRRYRVDQYCCCVVMRMEWATAILVGVLFYSIWLLSYHNLGFDQKR
jgi:hypothetical protein